MKIISPSKPKPPIMPFGRYMCRDCECVYDVETNADLMTLLPEPSWASFENSTKKLVSVICPGCGKREDSITAKKGWFD